MCRYADCWSANRTIGQAAKANFEAELATMVEQHLSFPSIVMWVVFNEGWGQYETERVTHSVKVSHVCFMDWAGAVPHTARLMAGLLFDR